MALALALALDVDCGWLLLIPAMSWVKVGLSLGEVAQHDDMICHSASGQPSGLRYNWQHHVSLG